MTESNEIIPISPKIVVLGLKSIDVSLGTCLEKKFSTELITHRYLTRSELKQEVLKCLEETQFFKDKEDAIKSIVEEAREVFTDKSEATIENFKNEVADYIISFGETPEKAYENTHESWLEDIEGDAWEDEEDWWEECEDDWYDDEEEW